MRIAFMGTPDFAVPTLVSLKQAGYDIPLVITQPDKPVGRKRVLTPPPVKVAALELGLDVFQPTSINKKESRQRIRDSRCDIAVVLAFGQILRKSVLDLFPLGCYNVHGSLLPKYRGAAPIQRAIMCGEEITGVTIMQMDEGLDTGPILLIREIGIDIDDTSADLFQKLAKLGAEAMLEAVRLVESGKAVFRPQPEESGQTYAAKITDCDSCIDWSRPSREIHNLIRAMNPAPGAVTCLESNNVKIWRSKLLSPETVRKITEKLAQAVDPGVIVSVSKQGVFVRTGDGFIELLEIQSSGGRAMSAIEFARGKRLESCLSCFGNQ